MSTPFRVTAAMVKDVDPRVWDELKRRVQDLGRVKVGVPEGPREADGTPVALIAAVHEFGHAELNIPERSFLRSTIRVKQSEYINLNRINLVRCVKGMISAQQVLQLLGEKAKGDVQRTIRNGDFVPLKPATIQRKGSSKPLIDSGNLLQSITYVVETP